MENYTDFNDVQQSYGLGQNTHFAHIESLSLPNSDTLRDLNYFPTHTHRASFNSTFSGGISFSEQPVEQQDITYNSHLNQYPSNNNWIDQGHVIDVLVASDDLGSCLDNNQDYYIGEQSSFSAYLAHNMATENPAIAAPIESGNTPGYRPDLRCLVRECSQDRKFPSESALRKHEANHNKPYICQVVNCKHNRFSDKGGLDRHNREVHGSQTYCCPITSCKRHIRGFPRKYNLFEHQKRCHASRSPNLAPPSILRQQTHIMKGQLEPYEGGSSSEIATVGGARLREKLENLYKMRGEMDVDIEALKRSLNLLGEDTP